VPFRILPSHGKQGPPRLRSLAGDGRGGPPNDRTVHPALAATRRFTKEELLPLVALVGQPESDDGADAARGPVLGAAVVVRREQDEKASHQQDRRDDGGHPLGRNSLSLGSPRFNVCVTAVADRNSAGGPLDVSDLDPLRTSVARKPLLHEAILLLIVLATYA